MKLEQLGNIYSEGEELPVEDTVDTFDTFNLLGLGNTFDDEEKVWEVCQQTVANANECTNWAELTQKEYEEEVKFFAEMGQHLTARRIADKGIFSWLSSNKINPTPENETTETVEEKTEACAKGKVNKEGFILDKTTEKCRKATFFEKYRNLVIAGGAILGVLGFAYAIKEDPQTTNNSSSQSNQNKELQGIIDYKLK